VWVKEHFVRVVAELEGRRDLCSEGWVSEGSVLSLSADRCRPGEEGLGPFVRVVFREWRGFGQSRNVTLRVDGPVEVVAVYGRDYTGLLLVAAGVAAVGGAFGYRQWKERITVTRRRRVVPMVDDSTRVYSVREEEGEEDETRTRRS